MALFWKVLEVQPAGGSILEVADFKVLQCNKAPDISRPPYVSPTDSMVEVHSGCKTQHLGIPKRLQSCSLGHEQPTSDLCLCGDYNGCFQNCVLC